MDITAAAAQGSANTSSGIALMVLKKAMMNDKLVATLLLQTLPNPPPLPTSGGLDTFA